jgi:hypothetical protein
MVVTPKLNADKNERFDFDKQAAASIPPVY